MVFSLVFIFGLVVGSFLNVLIDRIPKGENFVWKPSHCDYCKRPLRWFELIPVFSFILQGGTCRRCHKRLSLRYPISELLTAGGFVLLMPYNETMFTTYPLALIIFSAAVVIFFIDLKHQIIPDGALITIAVALLFLAIPLPPGLRLQHILAGGISALGFFSLWVATKGRGLGFGDVKLVLLIGLLLGYPGTVVALYVAFLTGAVTGVILIIANRAKMKTRIAFGPFLILGAVVAVFYSNPIVAWFYSLL